MQNAGLDEAQAVIKIANKNINNLTYADDTPFIAESEEELNSFLMTRLFSCELSHCLLSHNLS